MYIFMARNLRKQIQNITDELNKDKNIPLKDFKRAFMITSGYSFKKVNEWTQNFIDLKLIEINGEVVNIV